MNAHFDCITNQRLKIIFLSVRQPQCNTIMDSWQVIIYAMLSDAYAGSTESGRSKNVQMETH